MTGLQPAGLSHSETRGSKVICTYPRIIAAYRVLHRLREPRHPPCAFRNFHLIWGNGQRPEPRSYFQLCHHHPQKKGGTTHIRVLFSTVSLLSQHVKDRSRAVPTECRVGIGCRLSPDRLCVGSGLAVAYHRPTEVENNGFEPMASCVRCKRSSQAELIPLSV